MFTLWLTSNLKERERSSLFTQLSLSKICSSPLSKWWPSSTVNLIACASYVRRRPSTCPSTCYTVNCLCGPCGQMERLSFAGTLSVGGKACRWTRSVSPGLVASIREPISSKSILFVSHWAQVRDNVIFGIKKYLEYLETTIKVSRNNALLVSFIPIRKCILFSFPKRFTAVIRRLALNRVNRDYEIVECVHPEHQITLLHNVTVENQLPFDLVFVVKGLALGEIVHPGACAALHLEHHVGKELEIGFSCENFPRYDMIRVPTVSENVTEPVRIYDSKGRVLFLRALIKYVSGTVQVYLLIKCFLSDQWLIQTNTNRWNYQKLPNTLFKNKEILES